MMLLLFQCNISNHTLVQTSSFFEFLNILEKKSIADINIGTFKSNILWTDVAKEEIVECNIRS